MQEKIKAIVLENNKLTDDIYQLVCRVENADDYNFVAGQYVLFSKDFDDGEIRRAYSISSIPSDLPIVEFTVRRYEDGLMSSYLTSLKEGDEIEFGAGLGMFNVDKLKGKKVAMVAIGCGIAPLKSMISYWCENKDIDVEIDLFFGNRHISNIAYHELYEKLSNDLDYFNYYPCISQPVENGCKYAGRVGDVMKNMNYDFSNKEFYISGTMEMVNQMKDLIAEGGGDVSDVYFENIYPKKK